MLSSACTYAIRSVLYLAINSDKSNKIGAKLIAEELEVPQPFLAKLLQQLKRDKIVSSTKGPNGGFYLDEKNKEKAVWDIIMSIDGSSKFDNCFLGLAKCDGKNPCPVHFIVADFKKLILENFKDKSIKEYADKIQKGNQVISLKDINILNSQ